MADEQQKICKLCQKQPSCYTCPRCLVPYCSMSCYNGLQHRHCSEPFYKQQVQQQLHNHKAPEGSREQMKKMLQRLEQQDADVEAEFLADPQHHVTHDDSEELDSDDDEDLETRMKGIDLDDSDAVWERLTEEERRQFRELVESGDVTSILPPYEPWWSTSDNLGNDAVIVELSQEEASKMKQNTSENETEEGKSAEKDEGCSVDNTTDREKKHLEKDDAKEISKTDSSVTNYTEKEVKEIPSLKSKKSTDITAAGNSLSDTKAATIEISSSKTKKSKDLTGNGSCNTKAAASVRRKLPTATIHAYGDMPSSLRTKYLLCPTPMRVKPFASLISVSPSPLLRYSIANTVASYAWTVRLYNGDHHSSCSEATEVLLTLSAALSADASFSSLDEALASINFAAMQHSWLCGSAELLATISADTVTLLTAPRDLPAYYLHAALADLHCLVTAALASGKQDNKQDKTSSSNSFIKSLQGAAQTIPLLLSSSTLLKKIVRKIDFFLAYTHAHKTDLLRHFNTEAELLRLTASNHVTPHQC